MAYRKTGRISVRRTRRAYPRRRTMYRRPTYRVRRTRYRGRGRFRHTQNYVKFHAKSYISDLMVPVFPGEAGTGSLQIKQIDLNLQKFFVANYQLVEMMKNYQYVKFNYLAVHIKELNWVGYTLPTKIEEQFTSQGVTALNFNNLPVTCYWDVEQDMSFVKEAATNVNDTQFAGYVGGRKMYPGKKPLKFVWRFPQPWRQFYSTFYVNNIIFYPSGDQDIGAAMFEITGVKNMRYPKHIMISHNDFWKGSLPLNGSIGAAMFYAQFAIEFHIGVTFRGKRLIGVPVLPPKHAPIKEEDKDEENTNTDF
uniref:Putative capsid protein n=1 Tax=Periparus ater CRESS-DNA-virus sp. TaxID=2815050 RepID=A0A8A4XC90_9VIRU|nr:MAG: putative capsid protein [Periparus ater CRESS-DNA-virus sp.]